MQFSDSVVGMSFSDVMLVVIAALLIGVIYAIERRRGI